MIVRPAIRYFGGKFRIAPWVISFFPPHRCYVEPFGGAAGVLIQKQRSYAEVYNDLDGEVVNFFRVLRDPAQRAQLEQSCLLTPYSREEFDGAYEPTDDPVESARRLAVRAQMGFGSAGATKGTTGFRTDTLRSYGTAQHLWAEYPASIAAIGERFRCVLVENRPAVEVMQKYDQVDTLFFIDPPYVHATRNMRSQGGYKHEMTDDDHSELLEVLLELEGMVVLSGYDHDLYNDRLRGWSKHQTEARAGTNRGTSMRTEVVWLNPACAAALANNVGALFA